MKPHLRLKYFRAVFILLAALSASSLCAAPNISVNLNGASNQYVVVPNSTSLPPLHGVFSISLEAWVNVPAAGALTILSRGPLSGPDFAFQISSNGASGLEVSFSGGGVWDHSASSIPAGTWTHVAVTYDGTNKIFYINGVLDSTVHRAGILNDAGAPMFIGQLGGTDFLSGQIAEVRAWTIVRTASQIAQDMNSSFFGVQPGLAAYYRLNEGGGANANDASGNGHTGTLTNGAFVGGYRAAGARHQHAV